MNNGEFDPKFEITFLDKKVKKAFQNVGKDVDKCRDELVDFQNFVTKEFGKVLLAEEKVTPLLKYNKEVDKLKSNVDEISKSLKTFASEKSMKDTFDQVSKKLSELVDKKEYQEKIKKFDDILSEKHVRKIDLAKVETQVSNFRKELDAINSVSKSFQVLKEDFIDFKKKALTRYNFDKLEKWIQEIEKDILALVALKKKVDMLVSLKEAENMRRSFDRNTEEFIKMRKSFDKLLALHDDFSKSEKQTRVQFAETSKKFKDFDGDITALENDFDRMERRLVRLEKAEKKVKIVKATKPAKVKAKKSKKKGQNIFKRAIDWLLEDTD
ncbi:hypothetical protein KY335_05515 [Candidatus Woesearchaeota archaeon]|nr:hypothetical protein [Candidatus Woesearchaeota archaeon]